MLSLKFETKHHCYRHRIYIVDSNKVGINNNFKKTIANNLNYWDVLILIVIKDIFCIEEDSCLGAKPGVAVVGGKENCTDIIVTNCPKSGCL